MPVLNWIGKDKIVEHDKELPFRVLKPNKKHSVGESENLLIQGDNLEALKALMPFYYGKVKCIYIDPPYNTGKTGQGWVYNDKVDSPQIKNWLNKTVGAEGEDLCRHDKWLCMMYPRLKLLRQLLRDDGIIYISIDDNEVHHLKQIMDEIFVGNFVAQLPTVMNLKGNNDQFGFAGTHEYTLVYAKDIKRASFKEFPLDGDQIDGWIEDEVGFYKKGANLKATGVNAPRSARPNLFYPIYVNKNNEVSVVRNSAHDIELLPITDGKEMSWRWERKKVERDASEIIVVGDTDKISLYKKQRPNIGELPSKKPKTLFYKPEYSSGNGTAQLKKIFSDKVFNNPKPVDLIKDLIFLATNDNDLVLDSFAGSGTTGHAVLELNKEDDGKRKFILVELEEDIAGPVTAHRLKKVVEGYTGAKYSGGTGQGFEFLELNGELFGKDGFINQSAAYEDLASYIFYTETKAYTELSSIKSPFIGSHGSTTYYLVFNKAGDNLLGDKLFNELKNTGGKKVIFADKTLIDEEDLLKHDIVFKQIPYELRKF